MKSLPLLPVWKPTVNLHYLDSRVSHPETTFPFFHGGKLWVGSSTDEKDYLTNPVKTLNWKAGLEASPPKWFISYYTPGWHPSIQTVKAMFTGSEIPSYISKLYHPRTQVRILLGKSIGDTIEEARESWYAHWMKLYDVKGEPIKMH